MTTAHTDTDDRQEAREWMFESERLDKIPTACPIPQPGIYWVREASRTLVQFTDSNGVQFSRMAWKEPYKTVWQLAMVTDDSGYYSVFDSDEGCGWESDFNVVIECERVCGLERGEK